jgi:hypothetical protein
MFERRGVTDVRVQGGARSIPNYCKVSSFVLDSKGSSSLARLSRYKSSTTQRSLGIRRKTQFDQRPLIVVRSRPKITSRRDQSFPLVIEPSGAHIRPIRITQASRWRPLPPHLWLQLPVPPQLPLQPRQHLRKHPPTFPRSPLSPSPSRPRSNPPGPSFLRGLRARGTLSLPPAVKR